MVCIKKFFPSIVPTIQNDFHLRAAEPTPVSLRPVISVRSHTKIDQVVAKQAVESASCLDVEPPAQPMHLEKLEMEPELPHCILVLDKENADPLIEKEERKTVEHFAQPDGLLIREPELSELPGCTEPIKGEFLDCLGENDF